MQSLSLVLVAVLVALQGRPAVFEVASVKPFTDSVLILSGITTISKGRLSATAITLKDLVASTYRVRGQAIIGGPEWASSERYNIEARAANEAGEAELRLMLQALLADRFRLRLHKDTRDGAVYALGVGRGGPKLKAAGPDCDAGPGLITLVGRIIGKCGSAGQLAESLSRIMDRPVVDQTGRSGSFADVKLDWVPDETQYADFGRGVYARPVSDPSGPSLFTAIQEQLGLRLEPARAPIEVIVIESAERPTSN
jgi:bla regulator protein blaR1